MVTQKDFDWQDQTGAPNDPQAGNIPGGKRDVMEAEDFNDGTSTIMAAEVGDWNISGGKLSGASIAGGDAVDFIFVDNQLPGYYEITATVNAAKDRAGVKSNGYIIFDYYSDTDFKFAGINIATDKLEIGQRTVDGWVVETKTNLRLKPNSSYNLLVAINGTNATVVVDGRASLDFSFDSRLVDGLLVGLNQGYVGVGMTNSVTSFDNISVQKLPPEITFTDVEDFSDGSAGSFSGQNGSWSVVDTTYVGSAAAEDYALSTFDFVTAPSSYVGVAAELSTDGIAGLAFDYYEDGRFKFVAIDSVSNQVIVGHYTENTGFVIDGVTAFVIDAGADYRIEIGMVGTTISVTVNDQVVIGHVYNALLNDGELGAIVLQGGASFTSIAVLTDDPAYSNLLADSVGSGDAELLESDELETLSAAAKARWVESGLLSEEALEDLDGISFKISELGGRVLGVAANNVIQIDDDAAGNGWYIDPAPTDDTEYVQRDGQLVAQAGNGEVSQVDLLSVLNHEIGHILGFEHGESLLMENVLVAGERRTPDLTIVSNYNQLAGADYLTMDERVGELVARDFSSNAGQVTRDILAGRMVDWSL